MTTPTLHTLIVDDSIADVRLITAALRRSGYPIESERVDTEEALLEALRQHPWDLVLCDSVMPRLTILHALALVHGVAPRIPVVVVSGRQQDELAGVLASGEVSGVLSKEHLTDLPALVRSILAGN